VLTALDVEESMIDIRNERRAEIREEDTVSWVVGTIAHCEHLQDAPVDVDTIPEAEFEDCVAQGWTAWVHLRVCLACGHKACCDSSPRRHASKHFNDTRHPVIRSAEPGEAWRWCFVDDRLG
jgi:uncharacterized UBP type Zn finger protein